SSADTIVATCSMEFRQIRSRGHRRGDAGCLWAKEACLWSNADIAPFLEAFPKNLRCGEN
ncbi:MAG: hypothetical protein LBM70_06515, partial [Victivallales bacterium]|nr:hypothetical protein [Victivallales bacterium]